MSHSHANADEALRREDPEASLKAEHIKVLRLGHGANCSSIGSVLDVLFATAAVGSALFVAAAAALGPGAAAKEGDAPRTGSGDDRGDARADDEESKP